MRTAKKTIYEAVGRDPVHPFPARMAPSIALKILSTPGRRFRVLDPMMGSGTVVALARAKGHRAIGVDIDPLAVLISKVWTTVVDRDGIKEKADDVLKRARRIFKQLPYAEAYPKHADADTRKFVAYWFDSYARRQLASLARAIAQSRNAAIRNVLWCAFSRLIITKQAGASLAMDLAHSRPHKFFKRAPIKPFDNFPVAVNRVLKNCVSNKSKARGPAPSVGIGDARRLRIAGDSIDLVLTSPPYLNAIDYMRCSKFSLVWMGYSTAEVRRLRSESVGSEVGSQAAPNHKFSRRLITKLRLGTRLSTREKAILTRYIEDMQNAIGEVTRVLAPGGRAIYVMGENTIRGTYIRNSKIVLAIALKAGLKLQGQSTRTLPNNRRYLPPPSNRRRAAALDTRMRREVVLAFRKPMRRAGRRAAKRYKI